MNTQTIDVPSGAPENASAAAGAIRPIRVWDAPTRIFHWLFAVSFAGAWLTAESERWRDLHVTLGYVFGGLLAFRLVWGFVGTRYARFPSFAFPPSRVWSYLKSLASAPEHHVGHNPAGALAIFALLALGLAVAGSGLATWFDVGGDWVEELHEGAAEAMLALVAIHLVGVAAGSLLHRENLVRAMFTGVKRGRADEAIAGSRWPLGLALLFAVLAFWTADRAGWIGSGTAAGGSGKMADERGDSGEGKPYRRRDDD